MISSRVDADRAMDHVYMLSKKIGPRVGGLESEKQAAKYIASQLRSTDSGSRSNRFPFRTNISDMCI